MMNKEKKEILKKFRFPLIIYILLNLFMSIILIFEAHYLAKMLESITNGNIDETKKLLLIAFSITISYLIIYFIARFFQTYILNKLTKNVVSMVSMRSQKLSSQAIESTSSGAMTNYILDTPFSYVQWLMYAIFWILSSISTLIMCVYMCLFHYSIALIAVVYIVVSFILYNFFLRKQYIYGNIFKNISRAYKSYNVEIIKSQRDIKALNIGKKMNEENEVIIDNIDLSRTKKEKNALISSTVQKVINLIFFILLNILVVALTKNLYLIMVNAIYIFNNYSTFYNLRNNFGNSLKGIVYTNMLGKDIDDIYDETKFPTDKYGDKDIDRLKGTIEFKNVGFSYKYFYDKSTNSYDFDTQYKEAISKKQSLIQLMKKDKGQQEEFTQKVFENLNFKINAKDKVAFVGQSGSGKSTILNLIAKFSTCDSGQVLLDGVNINELSEKTLRQNICMVSQNTYIFNGTIRYNLQLVKPDATEEELKEACHKAYMDEFLFRLDDGLDTEIGENGIKLSGGQKQRLAIARAFLLNRAIVIFDESTSALDNESQAYIQDSILNFDNSTVIVVAHRLSTIINVNKIYYLQEGVIVNSGTFDELIEKNESFKNLFMTEQM